MAVLNSAPSPKRFAAAFGQEFGAAVRAAAGRDGRLSINEAKKISGPYADNALNYLEKTGQKSVSVKKLIGAAERYAFVQAEKASGGDGRVSLKDGEKLTGDLRADFFLLRGRGDADQSQPTVQERLQGFERHYSPWNEQTETGMMDYDFPQNLVVADFTTSEGSSIASSAAPAGSDMAKYLAAEAQEREGVITYDVLQVLKNPDDGSMAMYYSQYGETFQKLWLFDDKGELLAIQKHYDDGSEAFYLKSDLPPADRL